MRFVMLFLLIAFPIAELTVLINLFSSYGLWVLFYLVVVGLLGLQLIKEEKLLFSGRLMQQMMQGDSPFKAIFGSARNIFAGILLLVPGVITDVIAALLLLIPIKKDTNTPRPESQEYQTYHEAEPTEKNTTNTSDNYDIIEGEYRRED